MAPPRGANVSVLLKVDGGEELRKKLRQVPDLFIQEMAKALPEEAKNLGAEAQAGVPVEHGSLAASLAVKTSKKKTRISAAVGYTDHKAAAVHEGIHWAHREGAKEPGFHWFLKAFTAFAGGFIERIAQRLKRLVGGN